MFLDTENFQIEGLCDLNTKRQIFPSLNQIFFENLAMTIIGKGPNANIRTFHFILLNIIRRNHINRLKNQATYRQAAQELEFQRERKVSFNGKGGVFMDNNQNQNYPLSQLKLLAFRTQSDLTVIQGAAYSIYSKNVKKQSGKQKVTNKLTNRQMKRLLAQFFQLAFPNDLTKLTDCNQLESLTAITNLMNQFPVVNLILTILMRYILFKKYDLEDARNYATQLNDHTVLTALYDAFSLDGLTCKENHFELERIYKVIAISTGDRSSERTFILALSQDETQKERKGSSSSGRQATFRKPTNSRSDSRRAQSDDKPTSTFIHDVTIFNSKTLINAEKLPSTKEFLEFDPQKIKKRTRQYASSQDQDSVHSSLRNSFRNKKNLHHLNVDKMKDDEDSPDTPVFQLPHAVGEEPKVWNGGNSEELKLTTHFIENKLGIPGNKDVPGNKDDYTKDYVFKKLGK